MRLHTLPVRFLVPPRVSWRVRLTSGVERSRQIAAFSYQQGLEFRHLLRVQPHGRQAGIVRSLREPAVVRGVATPATLQRLVGIAHALQSRQLARAFVGVAGAACIQCGQFAARMIDQHAKAFARSLRRCELRIQGGVVLRRKPAPQAFAFDFDSKRFVEYRVTLGVGNLMRELVKNESRNLDLRIAHHRRRHRIVEISQRRVCRHTADIDVLARSSDAGGFGAGVGFGEIAAIVHASYDWKTPLARRQRKLGRRKDVPQNKATIQIRVAAIAGVVGQRKFATGVVANRHDALELALQRGILRGRKHGRNRFCALKQIERGPRKPCQ